MEAQSEGFEAVARYFGKAQKSTVSHASCLDGLEKIARSRPMKQFTEDFLTLLKPALAVDKAASAHAIDRLISFVSTFALRTSVSVGEEPFAIWLMHRILLWHDARSKAVRFRVMQLLALILRSLPEEAEIPSKIWNAMELALLRRAHDKASPVRLETVRALSRLQDPTEEGNKMVACLLRMLHQDPVREVRRTVVLELAISKVTVQPLLQRLRDADASVREAIYKVVERKLDVRMLRSKYRVQLVREGLRDRDESVQRAAQALCRQWLQNRPALARSTALAAVELLELLEPEKGPQHVEAAEILVEQLLSSGSVAFSAADAQLIEGDQQLSSSAAALLLWRVVAQRLHGAQDWAQVDALVPDVPRLTRMLERAAELERTAAVTQLLQLARFVDAADEAARLLLSSLLRALLPTLRDADVQVPIVMEALRTLHADADDCNRVVSEALNEVLQPVDLADETLTEEVRSEQEQRYLALEQRIAELQQAKRSTAAQVEELRTLEAERDAMEEREAKHEAALNTAWLRALRVAEQHLRHTPLDLRDAFLAGLKLRLVRRALRWGGSSAEVRQAALRVLGLLAVRDLTVAREQLPLFLHALANEEELVQEAVLHAIFDLLARYGASLFAKEGGDAEEAEQAEPSKGRSVSQSALMEQLYAFFDADDVVLRGIVVEGFAKLLFMRQLADQRALGIMLLMFFNPATALEDARLQQLLAQFFPAFAYAHGGNQRLIANVLPRVLKAWQAAQASHSPLARVSGSRLLQYMLDLTDPRKLRAYWAQRPQQLATLEVNDALHHTLAQDLLSDHVLRPQHDAAVALPVLRALALLAYDTAPQHAASLCALADKVAATVQFINGAPKLRIVLADVSSVSEKIRELADAAVAQAAVLTPGKSATPKPGPRESVAAVPESARRESLLNGLPEESPQLDAALTRTAKKQRAPVDRRLAGATALPTLNFDGDEAADENEAPQEVKEMEEPAAEREEQEEEEEGTVAASSTSTQPDVDADARKTGKKRGRQDPAAPSRAKKARTTAREKENEANAEKSEGRRSTRSKAKADV